ncbi:immunity 49 family protein [Streptomyces avicenniae]|uniref:immunity 49 family protein n=1 Tax=Streptomyces avicenniae TaxID=500153 RepID=UPI001CBA6361|nr:immunity 49 family protein [Streptomyces avicenniae]
MNGDNDVDPELPMLTAAQAVRLRTLAAPHTAHVQGVSLHNLAYLCRQAPEDHWPELVRTHFAQLRQAGQGDESPAELLSGVHARLLPADALTPELAAAMRYARPVAEGLVLVHAHDAPTTIRTLTDSDVERAGHEALSQAAFANLARVPVNHDVVTVSDGASLHSVHGDSPFVASKALILSQLAEELTGEALPDAGALVVVPTRHLLAYHPITDGSVVGALNDLASYALGAYQDGPGPLSPRVYWWHRDRLTSLSVFDGESRVFSLEPPAELLGVMRSLVRLDTAGRLARRAPDKAPDDETLTRTVADAVAGLARDPSGLAGAFAATLDLAYVRSAADPHLAGIDAWDAWAAAVQLGTALFTGTGALDCRLGEDLVRPLPALPAAPPPDARAWLDAFYLALVCRQRDRLGRLCQVPFEALRQDSSADAYVLHWIDTLRSYVTQRPMDEIANKLTATIKASWPEAAVRTPKSLVDRIDYQPVALFHRLITRNHAAFAETLAEAVERHGTYWAGSAAPRAHVALGPLAIACLAYDDGFPLPARQRFLPGYLLNRERIESIPG